MAYVKHRISLFLCSRYRGLSSFAGTDNYTPIIEHENLKCISNVGINSVAFFVAHGRLNNNFLLQQEYD